MSLSPRVSALALLAALCATAPSAQQFQAGIENEVAVEGYNNEPINSYSATADFRLLGRGVGMLSIQTDGGSFPCTAFLVDATHLLTNHHCVPGILDNPQAKATRIESVSFLAGYLELGREDEAQRFEVNPVPVETSAELDYTVLEVKGVPVDRFPPLPLSADLPEEGTPFWIIGHPLGKSQHISREGCRAARPVMEPAPAPQTGDRLRHTCDTLGGNSGSPIIDSSARQVIGLHNSGDRNVGVNFGIPMATILKASKVLKAAPPAEKQPLPMVAAVFPKRVGVGQEISVVADVPGDCVPAIIDISPTQNLTPIPLEIFEKVPLSEIQARYQVTVTSNYKIVVLEEDEKGEHKLGALCSPAGLTDPAQLKDALRGVVGALAQGKMDGKVEVAGGTVTYAFTSYVIE